jgi:hypothetical protein
MESVVDGICDEDEEMYFLVPEVSNDDELLSGILSINFTLHPVNNDKIIEHRSKTEKKSFCF